MPNITDICNRALAVLGKNRIVSIDEASEPARQCKLFYTSTKQSLLRKYDWGFAKKVVALAMLTQKHPRWEYSYIYPEKCIRAISIFAKDRPPVDMESRKEKYEIYMANDNQCAIACNIGDAYMEYIYDVDDANVFPVDFAEALVHLLASNMALQLNGNYDMKVQEYQLAMAYVRDAVGISAMERQREPEFPNKYVNARG